MSGDEFLLDWVVKKKLRGQREKNDGMRSSLLTRTSSFFYFVQHGHFNFGAPPAGEARLKNSFFFCVFKECGFQLQIWLVFYSTFQFCQSVSLVTSSGSQAQEPYSRMGRTRLLPAKRLILLVEDIVLINIHVNKKE